MNFNACVCPTTSIFIEINIEDKMTLRRSGINPMLLLFFKELAANLEEDRKLGLLAELVVERQLLSALCFAW